VVSCKYEPTTNAPENSSATSTQSSEAELPKLLQCGDECTCSVLLMNQNDTGVTFWGDVPTENFDDCSNDFNKTQDCSNGRDSLNKANLLIKKGAGNAAFDFTKINDNGHLLDENSLQWECVLDNNTGLLWEVKQTQHSGLFRDSIQLYTWFSTEFPSYSSEINASCSHEGFCDTQKFINKINSDGMCGFTDWRLPTKVELQDLIDYGSSLPALDINYFPNTQNGKYWTSTVDVDDVSSIWTVNLFFGAVGGGPSSDPQYIRLVREQHKTVLPNLEPTENEQNINQRVKLAPIQRCNQIANLSSPIARFKQDTQGNVYDNFTGLIWQRCVLGQTGELCEQGEPFLLDWQKAQNTLEQQNNDVANRTQWRLPNIKELQSTIETQCEEPPLNPFVFPNIPLIPVWSSTPSEFHTDKTFHYNYQNGILSFGLRTQENAVHFVRDCQ